MMRVRNNLPSENVAGGIRLGVIAAHGIDPGARLTELDRALEMLIKEVASVHSAKTGIRERRRLAARDMLRNGRYKPTGRGKPASEYLVRSAVEGTFPRINALVDINNLISLDHSLPISLWDLTEAASNSMVFRLGEAGEAYAFNPSGQVLELADLAVGCAAEAEDEGVPIISPIKDSQRTKTNDNTQACGVAIYAPAIVVSTEELETICEQFRAWLLMTRAGSRASIVVVNVGDEAELA